MKNSQGSNSIIHSKRNIWLLTIVSILIVLFGLIVAGIDPETGFSFNTLAGSHKDNRILFLFDTMPVWIYIILNTGRKWMLREAEQNIEERKNIKKILEKNTAFARMLSEGDEPTSDNEMLQTELGQALKLLHLNIKSNRRKEKEITWITEGKEIISRVLRVYNEIDELAFQVLKSISKYIGAVQGAMYLYDKKTDELTTVSVLAYNRKKYISQKFGMGEGLVGQCAYEMDYIYRTEIPDDYATITTGILGDQKPKSILLIPLITSEKLQGVMEFAFLHPKISKLHIQFNLELGEIIARTFYNLRVNEQTRALLEESREMTAELQKNEQDLQKNALEMKHTQEELQEANLQLQEKIKEEKLAQDRLNALLKNASEIIAIYDENIHLKFISPSVTRILGYTEKEMIKGKDFERIDGNSSKTINKIFEQLRSSPGESSTVEYTFIRKDGIPVFLHSTITNLLEDPAIEGFLFNTRDITESKQIEKEQRMKFRMRSLSENSLDLILRINPEGIVYYVNPVVEDYTGISASGIVNKSLSEIPFSPALTEVLEHSLHQIRLKAKKFNLTENIPVELGEITGERILNINVIPEFQEDELETILFVGHDITEAKRIEKEINTTNRKMQDSINYAERIQSSILPSNELLRKAFPKSFVYYLPKDVISGDFPWFFESEDAWYIAVVDCTGHGVPGALLSFIGFFLLNNISGLHPELNCGEICDELNAEVRKTLKQDKNLRSTRDGMDIALCKLSKKTNRLEFAGAHRPMYLLREGELNVFKGDSRAIGGLIHPKLPEKPFNNNVIDLRKGDKFFIFSDGLSDQLGEKDGSKYSPSRIRNQLLENSGFTIEQFHAFFKKDFSDWKGNQKQIDDVLLIGIEYTTSMQ